MQLAQHHGRAVPLHKVLGGCLLTLVGGLWDKEKQNQKVFLKNEDNILNIFFSIFKKEYMFNLENLESTGKHKE